MAAIACLATTFQTVHLTIVEHAVCALHGSVYHVDAEHPPPEAAATSRVPVREVTPSQVSSDSRVVLGEHNEHEQDSCTAVAHPALPAVEPPPPPLTVLAWQLAAVPPPAMRVGPARDLWRLAPKTSPPA